MTESHKEKLIEGRRLARKRRLAKGEPLRATKKEKVRRALKIRAKRIWMQKAFNSSTCIKKNKVGRPKRGKQNTNRSGLQLEHKIENFLIEKLHFFSFNYHGLKSLVGSTDPLFMVREPLTRDQFNKLRDITMESFPELRKNNFKIIVRNVPCWESNDMYDLKRGIIPEHAGSRTEFVLIFEKCKNISSFVILPNEITGNYEMRLDGKSQNVSGTAKNKMENTILANARCAPENNCAVILDGKNFSQKDYNYYNEFCKTEAIQMPNKKMKIMWFPEFKEWASNNISK